MLRKLLGTGLLLATLAGCTKLEGKECAADGDCGGGGRCDTSLGLCYQGGTEPETDKCDPACAPYQVCTTAGCQARFSSLTIESPADNAVLGVGTVQVKARLVVNPTYTSTQPPDTLLFKASRSDGVGDVGTFENVTRSGETYTADWKPPAAQAQIVLTAEHPTFAAVKSPPVTVQLDATPPEFTLTFPTLNRQAGTPGSQAAYGDSTPGYEAAFRRDESVIVRVSANEPVNEVTLTVIGIGAGGTPGQALAAKPVANGASGCPGAPPFCGSVTVDLFEPEMIPFRGEMGFRVEGKDAVENQSSKTAQLRVTRLKWAFDAQGAINSTPAVGSRGTVYFGTDETIGKMFAVGPDGALKWPAALSLGQIGSSPAVGAPNGTEEYVYVSAKSGANAVFYALQGSNGGTKASCPLGSNSEVESAIAVGPTPLTVGTTESGIAVFNSTPAEIVALRPDAIVETKCLKISGAGPAALPTSVAGSSLVMKDQRVFYAATGSRLTCYDYATGSNSPCAGWPQNTNSLARGLAIVDDKIYGGAGSTDEPNQGSLFSSPLTGGSSGGAVSFVYPSSNTSRVFNLAIGAGKIAYFGAETSLSNRDLLALVLDVGGAMPSRALDAGTMRGAPVFGKNDRLYTLNTQGRLTGWTASSLTRQWEEGLETAPGQADVSPTLDCLRDASGPAAAKVGSLYVASGTKLYAVIVDSPGLEAAPWPKFQHDVRNTGNTATPITNCP